LGQSAAGVDQLVAIAQPGLCVLLAALALSANRVVPTSALIETLWQEAPSREREQNLHSRVYQLRRVLCAHGCYRAANCDFIRDHRGKRHSYPPVVRVGKRLAVGSSAQAWTSEYMARISRGDNSVPSP
jgi:hypothetical protein